MNNMHSIFTKLDQIIPIPYVYFVTTFLHPHGSIFLTMSAPPKYNVHYHKPHLLLVHVFYNHRQLLCHITQPSSFSDQIDPTLSLGFMHSQAMNREKSCVCLKNLI